MHKIDAAGHVNNEFVEEDAATNRPPTYFSAAWFNAVQAELANVIESDGTPLSKTDNFQLLKYLNKISSRVGEIATITSTVAPQYAIKANGALLSRAAYPELWAHAQASGLLEANDAAWLTNKAANGTNGKYSPGDGSTNFRIPDPRGDFIRIAADGSTLDSGRAVGSTQTDQIKAHTHSFPGNGVWIDNPGTYIANSGGSVINMTQSLLSGSTGGSETRPHNTAYIAVIYYK